MREEVGREWVGGLVSGDVAGRVVWLLSVRFMGVWILLGGFLGIVLVGWAGGNVRGLREDRED